MKVQTFKKYIRNLLNNYLDNYYEGVKPTISFFDKNIKDDHRLITFAQAYYVSVQNFKQCNKFTKYTGYSFDSLDDFFQSDTKYAVQYKHYTKMYNESKNHLRIEISKLKQEKAISNYLIWKKLNIPQINISNFLLKEVDESLSIDKAKEILDFCIDYSTKE